MTESIDSKAYSNIKQVTVYSSKDGDKNSSVDLQESGVQQSSIFSQKDVKSKMDTAFKNLQGEDLTKAKNAVTKYLGSALANAISGFKAVTYTAKEINDSENAAPVQKAIDDIVKKGIADQTTTISQSITAKIQTAINQAYAELKGDKDLGNKSTVINDAQYGNTLENITYRKGGTEGATVSTFASSADGAEESNQTKGFQQTVAYLKANGKVKTETREVNGQQMTVYIFKGADGKKQHAVIDDAGQIHNLETTSNGLFSKKKFTTSDSVDDATSANNIPKDAKDVEYKRRKVDGQYQTVVRYTDDKGQKHAVVVETNDQTGETASSEVTHVNAGLKAKYTSGSSGLSAYANDSANSTRFDDGKVRTGNGVAGSQRSRGKLDAKGLNVAITAICSEAKQKGGSYAIEGNKTTVTINGHKYTIDNKDYKSADRTIRMLKAELNGLKPASNGTVAVDTTGIIEDNRKDANDNILNRSNYGVNVTYGDHSNATSNTPNKYRKISYNSDLTQRQFKAEGWGSNTARTKESNYLEKMDALKDKTTSTSSKGKSVRNFQNATEFAERFAEAYNTEHSNSTVKFDINKLANAIKTANPSLFDADGKMYKNADFAKINLPDFSKQVPERFKSNEA